MNEGGVGLPRVMQGLVNASFHCMTIVSHKLFIPPEKNSLWYYEVLNCTGYYRVGNQFDPLFFAKLTDSENIKPSLSLSLIEFFFTTCMQINLWFNII